MISPVFWIASGKYGFQRVGSVFRVYDRNGDFLTEFNNFFAMCDWITDNGQGKHEKQTEVRKDERDKGKEIG